MAGYGGTGFSSHQSEGRGKGKRISMCSKLPGLHGEFQVSQGSTMEM